MNKLNRRNTSIPGRVNGFIEVLNWTLQIFCFSGSCTEIFTSSSVFRVRDSLVYAKSNLCISSGETLKTALVANSSQNMFQNHVTHPTLSTFEYYVPSHTWLNTSYNFPMFILPLVLVLFNRPHQDSRIIYSSNNVIPLPMPYYLSLN